MKRGPYKKKPEAERFWPRVDKNGPIPSARPELGNCWLWTGGKQNGGYGAFQPTYDGAKAGHIRAHVWAWEQEHGPVPENLELDHLCSMPPCVRPSHLEAVTHVENMRRGRLGAVQRARHAAVTHCPRGHEYTPENTYVDKKNCRQCKTCKSERQRRYYAARTTIASRQRRQR